MKKMMTMGIVVLMASSMVLAADVSGWNAFVIRQGGDVSPAINDITCSDQPAKEFVISANGMKAGWGTNSVNGLTVGDLSAISIERLDDTSRFVEGSGAAKGPYLNLWVTDGLGHYAIIANEPSNPEWTDNKQWNMNWAILSTKTLKVYDTPGSATNTSWVHAMFGTNLTFAQVASLVIEAPSAEYIQTASNGVGTGAPKVLGTNVAYGINWVFGDTQSNYVSGETPGYIVSNPTVVPEPATICFLALSGLGLLRRRHA